MRPKLPNTLSQTWKLLVIKFLRSGNITGVQIHRAESANDHFCGTLNAIIEPSCKALGIFRSHRRRAINGHVY